MFIRISIPFYDITLYCIVVSILGPNFFLLLYSHKDQFTHAPLPDGTLALVMQSCGQALLVTLKTLLLEWLVCNCSALPHIVSLLDTLPTFLLKRCQAYLYTWCVFVCLFVLFCFVCFFPVRPDHRKKKKIYIYICMLLLHRVPSSLLPVDPNSQLSSETLDENI